METPSSVEKILPKLAVVRALGLPSLAEGDWLCGYREAACAWGVGGGGWLL